MNIQLGDGKEYHVEDEVVDYLVLKYGSRLLEQYEKLDSTIQFGMKIVTKQVVKEFLKAFGVDAKLPRGTDPSVYLIRAYIILMNESMKRANLKLVADESNNTIYEQQLTFSDIDAFPTKMAGYLENLKHYASASETVAAAGSTELPAPNLHRTGAELAAGGQETFRQDDGGEEYPGQLVPAIS